jgi:glutathionylspermidine synthase
MPATALRVVDVALVRPFAVFQFRLTIVGLTRRLWSIRQFRGVSLGAALARSMTPAAAITAIDAQRRVVLQYSQGRNGAEGLMQRIASTPRTTLDARAQELGFTFAKINGEIYWDERAYYAFSLQQVERDLEDPSQALHELCLALVDRVIKDDALLTRLAIPAHAWPLVRASWNRRDPSLYGRFDFAYDGTGPAKLLEYNADTPTALFEASVFQWVWLEDLIAAGVLPAGSDQFNSIHEKVLAALKAIKAAYPHAVDLHLACVTESDEDKGLIAYLEDLAFQAGFDTATFAMRDIGTRGKGPFVDLDNEPIKLLFKLYPWEWMLAETFGRSPSMKDTRFIEPPWKAVLSTKGILPLLWEMAPGHPNLLEAYFEDDPHVARLGDHYARKPLHSREGANIMLVQGSAVQSADGEYGDGPCIRQALAPLPTYDGNHPVIGSWIIGDQPAGIGIREDASAITRNTSRFVPHVILP